MAATAKMQHPKGLYFLFFTEMWERFSFYGMRALLVLYMTKALMYSDNNAYGVYAAYGALVYAFPLLGGFLADRFLGYRKAIIIGGILMMIGHFMMAIEQETFFYLALSLLCLGNGFFKPNISSIVGSLYGDGDARRDAGFTIFYMGINLGAFLSPLACGLIGEKFGWHYGFGLAGIGMGVGLITFLNGQKYLEDKGLPPSTGALKAKVLPGLNRLHTILLGSILLIPFIAFAIKNNEYVGSILYVVGAAVLIWLGYTTFSQERIARDRLMVLTVLILSQIVFWAFFEQAGSSLTLFADRHVNLNLLGFDITASVTQSFNPLFIIALGPLFSMLWIWLQSRKMQPSVPMKFALAMVQVGVGFAILVIGARFASADAKTGMMFLVLSYLLQTTGELCLSPVGLSAVTKLAPKAIVSTMMGIWFLATSFSHHFAGIISKMTSASNADGSTLPPTEALSLYSEVFWQIFIAATAFGVFLGLITRFLKKRMHGVE